MNKPESRIPQEHIDEIFSLATELQAKHEQTYSVAELQKIGAEAQISPDTKSCFHRILKTCVKSQRAMPACSQKSEVRRVLAQFKVWT